MTGIDWNAVKAVVEMLVLVAVGCQTFYLWYSNRRKADRQEISAIAVRLDHSRERVSKNEGRLDRAEDRLDSLQALISDHIPSKDDFHNLANAITALEGEVKVLTERAKGTDNLMQRMEAVQVRIEDHLLKGAGT